MQHRRRRARAAMRWLLSSFLLLLTVMLSPTSAGAAPALLEDGPGRAPAASITVNGDTVQVGDLVASGQVRPGGTCDFAAPLHVRTTAPGQGTTKWLVIGVDGQCRAVVLAKWLGTLAQGPSSLVDPLQRQLSMMRWTPSTSSPQAAAPSVLLDSKTSHQFVYTYGGGGPSLDKLTSVESQITFTWDGTNATITAGGESCGGADPPGGWYWSVDWCGVQYQDSGPRDVVWRTSRGAFHCEPPSVFPCNGSDPDGYYHNLYASEDGHGNGVSHCDYWYDGQLVFGPNREIWQGCS